MAGNEGSSVMNDEDGPPEKPGEDATAEEVQEYLDAYDEWLDAEAAEEIRSLADE